MKKGGREMEESRKGKVLGSLNLCTKAYPIDFHGRSLDADSLTQILARLPAKSVIRFKLVCKSWLSLISSDYFRRLHTLCKPPPSLILTAIKRDPFSLSKKIIEISELSYCSNQVGYIKRSNEKQRIIPSDICYSDIFIVLRCCNGLVLLWDRHHGHGCYVYNPTTNHSEKILLPEFDLPPVSLHLVFDPSKSLHNYKIVCIRQQIRAFDSESGKWSVCVEGFTSGDETCLFYLIHCGLLYCFNIMSQFIVCPLPKLADQGQVYHDILQESNGCLYYCAFVSCVSLKSAAALWELQVNGGDPRRSKWLLKYHHSVPRLPVICVWMLAFIRETSTALFLDYGNIMAYSFVDKSYKELLHLEPFSTPIHYFVHVNRFGETLP